MLPRISVLLPWGAQWERGEEEWKDVLTPSLCQRNCLRRVSAPMRVLALLSRNRGRGADELQVPAENVHLPHYKSCGSLEKHSPGLLLLEKSPHQKFTLEVQKKFQCTLQELSFCSSGFNILYRG